MFQVDTFSEETISRYSNTELWKPWMSEIRLRQITSVEELEEYFEKHTDSPVMGWDLETKSLDNSPENVCGHCIAMDEMEAIYIPTQHETHAEKNLPHDIVMKMVTNEFEGREVVVYNWAFEGRVCRKLGMTVAAGPGGVLDAMVYRWLYDSDKKQFNLKDAADELLKMEMLHIQEVPGVKIGKKAKDIAFHMSDPSDATLYAAADPVMTLRILNHLRPKVDKEQDFIVKLEHKLMDELLEMEKNRITIDRAYLRRSLKEIEHWKRVVEGKIYRSAGKEFNIGSSKEVGDVLHEMGLALGKTATGKRATSKKAIEDLAGDHEIVRDILFWRSLDKERGTYVEALLNSTTEENPSAVFKFRSVGAPTGRFASGGVDEGDPIYSPMNVQAIPSASKYQKAECHIVKNPTGDLELIDG